MKVRNTGCRKSRLTGLIHSSIPASRISHFLFSIGRVCRHPRICNQRGQVAVMVALLATVLLSSIALVVDTGAAYQTRRSLQSGADAAALAGIMEIAENRGQEAADAVARRYIADNLGEDVNQLNVTFPADNKVKVEVEKTQPTFFAKIFGVNFVPVGARATASAGVANEVTNLMPLIVPEQRVDSHIGPENEAIFELGEDRPLDSLSIIYSINGNRVTYTVTYINTGNDSINLEMWSPIPAGASYIDGSAGGGGVYDGTNVRWTWTGVAAGDNRSATYVVEFGGAVNPTNEVFASIDGGSAQSASTASGPQTGFFWLTNFDAGSGGSPDFNNWIVDGYPNPVGVGAITNGTGVKASLKSAMDQRLAKDSSVILPLYDYTAGGGHNGEYRIVGFAEFVITDFSFTGNPKQITGYFTDGAVTSGYAGGTPADYGVKAIWLSE
jgi:uncharacterized repeat protein (TIGR01451 family)